MTMTDVAPDRRVSAEFRPVPGTDRLAVAGRQEYLMLVSMALLLVSTTPGAGLIGDVVKVIWLLSVVVLTAYNIGAAFGVYITAVALFAHFSGEGWGTVFGRPDNYALLILVAGLVVRVAAGRSARPWTWSLLVIVAFVGYGLVQTAGLGLITRGTFAWYMRAFGLPMLMFVMLAQSGVSLRECRALVRALLVLGAYMAVISLAERAAWTNLLLPPWLEAPPPDPRNPDLLSTMYPGRSGGLLMQPAWNGLALSLILCLAILSTRLFSRRGRWFGAVVAPLCLLGVFLTYTRAVWLACGFACLALLLRPAATKARTRIRRFGVLVASAGFVGAMMLMPDTTARQRIGDSGTVLFRFNLWRAGLSMAADRPLIGSGFGSFGNSIAEYQQVMTVGGQANISATPVHNTVLSVLVEMGTIGLALYLGALLVVFRRARTAARELWGREGAAWVVIFAGVYFLQAQFAFAHEPATNQILFGMLGVIAGLRRRGRGPRWATPRNPPTFPAR
jgi:hypothetical protein